MRIHRICALGLVLCLLLCGCETAPAPTVTTVPSSSTVSVSPTTPQLCKAYYFTSLEVNFGGYFVTTVTVTYDDDSLTQTYTSDGTTYQNTYDYHGRLLRQRMDSESFWSEETRTYQGAWTTPLTVTYTREGFTSTVERTFDENGHVLTKHYSDSDDSWNTTVNTYDENGNQLTEKYTSSGGSDTLLTNTYDENGQLIHAVTLNRGVKTREVTHKYDEKGRVIQDYVWRYEPSSDFTSASTTDFTYDENGNTLTQYQHDLSGYWSKTESTYTADNKLLTERFKDSDGYITAKENVYDENGFLIAGTETYGGSTYTYAYENHTGGRWLRKTVTNPDGQVETTTRSFSGAGLLEQTVTYADGTTEREVRTYDHAGNLLTYTAYYNDTVSSTCSYTYALADQLQPQEQTRLLQLMQTVFVEFMP